MLQQYQRHTVKLSLQEEGKYKIHRHSDTGSETGKTISGTCSGNPTATTVLDARSRQSTDTCASNMRDYQAGGGAS